MRWTYGWVLIATGCGAAIDETNFDSMRQVAYCDALFACSSPDLGTGALEDCYDDASTGTGGETCTFDKKAARDCVDAYADATCAEMLDPYFTPDACAQVCL